MFCAHFLRLLSSGQFVATVPVNVVASFTDLSANFNNLLPDSEMWHRPQWRMQVSDGPSRTDSGANDRCDVNDLR